MKLGARARAHGRRAGHPWLPSSNLHLSSGPHLFLDWRFVLPGELGLIGPYWAARDGTPIPLRVRDAPEWKDRPIDASYAPTDVPQGIRIAAQPAEKGEPFPEHGPPGARIIHDDGIYRSWYKTPEDSRAGVLHYAESSDGYDWRNITACQVDWSACPDAAGSESPELFVDPTAPESERFKMFVRSGVGATDDDKLRILEQFQETRPDDIYPAAGDELEHLSGMYGAVSPDGVHWKAIPGPLVIHYSDTTNVVHYDAQLEKYVWYARCNWFYGRRSIGRAETDDFRRWPGPEMLVWPSTGLHPSDDWYTNSKTTYPGAADHHLMFPALYHHADDTTELRIFSSPDGIIWSEVPGDPSADPRTSPAHGTAAASSAAWTWCHSPATGSPCPYTGYLYPHKYPRNSVTMRSRVAYAHWPAGRLGALEAPEAGSFTTLPLVFEGNSCQPEPPDEARRPRPRRGRRQAGPPPARPLLRRRRPHNRRLPRPSGDLERRAPPEQEPRPARPPTLQTEGRKAIRLQPVLSTPPRRAVVALLSLFGELPFTAHDMPMGPMVTQGQGTPISIFPRRTGGRGTSPHPPKKCFKMLHLFHFISEVWDTWQALGTLLGREKRCFGTLWARLVQGFRRCRLGYVGAFARRVCPWGYVSTCVRGGQ